MAYLSAWHGRALRWRHNERDSVSNHQPHDCLLNRLFRRRSKQTSKLRVTGLCVGNLPGTGEFPAQMASYTENVSIWWRHHGMRQVIRITSAVLFITIVHSLYCDHYYKSQEWNSAFRTFEGVCVCDGAAPCAFSCIPSTCENPKIIDNTVAIRTHILRHQKAYMSHISRDWPNL